MQNLKNALMQVITALKEDTVQYNWRKQEQCNCGLIVQSLLKITPTELKYRLGTEQLMNKLENPTWKNLCKTTCSVTGKSTSELINELIELGFTPKDIVHLEYMSNEAILERANFESTTITETTVKKRLFLKNIEVKKEIPLFDTDYHENPKALILYLEAWLSILNEEQVEIVESLTLQDLEIQLLLAEANQDNELANKIQELKVLKTQKLN